MSLDDIFDEDRKRQEERRKQQAESASRAQEAEDARLKELRSLLDQADKESQEVLKFVKEAHFPAMRRAGYSIEHAFLTNNRLGRSGRTPYDGVRLYFGRLVAHRFGDFAKPYDADHELWFEFLEEVRGFRVFRNSRRSVVDKLGNLPFPVDKERVNQLVSKFIRLSLAEDAGRDGPAAIG